MNSFLYNLKIKIEILKIKKVLKNLEELILLICYYVFFKFFGFCFNLENLFINKAMFMITNDMKANS